MRSVFAVLFTVICMAGLTACAERSARRSTSTTPISVSGPPNVIPAGTTIEVRTIDAINSESAAEGRTYSAEVARDIVGSNGETLVPRGSPARLVVLEVSEGGRLKGEELELGLRSVTIRGQAYEVTTPGIEKGDRGLGANRRTAEMVGGGALLGTLIGAAAGGGKGAAIGAIAGAAAGAGVQVLTKGKEVRIPAETLLTFRLDQPINLERAG